MESTVDQDQQWLINCLNATLDTNQQVRSFAETSLHQASLQPGSLFLSLYIYLHLDIYIILLGILVG